MPELDQVTEMPLVDPGVAAGPDREPDGEDSFAGASDAGGEDSFVAASDPDGEDSFAAASDADGEDSFVAASDPDGEDSFVAAFDAFSQAIRRARGAGADHPGGLTFSQYALLRTLAGRDGARVSDLAGQAAVTPSTATRILDALERRAIVCRTRSAHDRRGVTVTLTDAGRAALHRQDAWMQGRQRAFYAHLPEHERALAPDLLLRMSALIDELAAGPQD
jgi:DNA-binding MarR family transcriptional regulator